VTPVRYHEAAENELLNEIGYLELRAKGLGRPFFAEVRRAESLIAQFPESAPGDSTGTAEARTVERDRPEMGCPSRVSVVRRLGPSAQSVSQSSTRSRFCRTV